MTNCVLLEKRIKDSGMTKAFISNKMGRSRTRLYKILNGAECTVSEMISISNILQLTNKERNDIFLR